MSAREEHASTPDQRQPISDPRAEAKPQPTEAPVAHWGEGVESILRRLNA